MAKRPILYPGIHVCAVDKSYADDLAKARHDISHGRTGTCQHVDDLDEAIAMAKVRCRRKEKAVVDVTTPSPHHEAHPRSSRAYWRFEFHDPKWQSLRTRVRAFSCRNPNGPELLPTELPSPDSVIDAAEVAADYLLTKSPGGRAGHAAAVQNMKTLGRLRVLRRRKKK
jgi:hypothetical protein